MKKQRVLMVHNFYQIGGGEHTVFENEVKLLRNKGHFVKTYTRHNDELNTSIFNKIKLPFDLIWSRKTYREIKAIIEEEAIDLVHCHNTFPLISPSVYYAAMACKVPIIQTVHNYRFVCPNGLFFRSGQTCEDCLAKGLYSSIKYKCYRDSRMQTIGVVAMLMTHRLMRTYQKITYCFLTSFSAGKIAGRLSLSPDQYYIKPNFTFMEDQVPFGQQLEVEGSCKEYYLYIGRLEENKGILNLCRYWENHQNRELRIFGEGPLEKEIKEIADRCKYIHYFGFADHEELVRHLKFSKAMIFPSELYEGFPMVILEAMSLGTPTITRALGNQSTIIKPGTNGYHYNNDAELTEAIEKITTCSRIRENTSHYYQKHFSIESNYQKMLAMYELANDFFK